MRTIALVLLATFATASCQKKCHNGCETYPANVPAAGEMPVLAWHSIPGEHTSESAYREMREAGFNLSYTDFRDGNQYLKPALDAAGKAGIKIFLRANALRSDERRGAVVNACKDHPALAGWFLDDEPTGKGFFDAMSSWRKGIVALDNTHPFYANLLPDLGARVFANMGLSDYDGYLDYYVEKLKPPFLSCAWYPIVNDLDGKAVLHEDIWFSSLEKMSRKAKRHGIAFWAFALSTAHSPTNDPNRPNPASYYTHFPIPTIEHLRIQIWNDLAYGAQGLQYFTYWTPSREESGPYWYGGGPKESDGTTGPAYSVVAAMNSEVGALSGVFNGCKVRWVRHTGDKIPAATTPLTTDDLPAGVEKFETTGKGATVSLLTNQGFTFLVAVNRDIDNDMTVSMKTSSDRVKMVTKGAAIVDPAANGQYTVTPGDILIFVVAGPGA